MFQLDLIEVIHRRFPGPWASAKLSKASAPTMWGHWPICKLEVTDAPCRFEVPTSHVIVPQEEK